MLALLELRARALSGEWDVIVVDCAPTAETLRLLALPEALGWYMERIFPVERKIVKALGPMLSKAAKMPMPEDSVFGAIERLHAELDEVHGLLTGPDASVRIVLTPESVVLAEARRSYTMLSLFGYRVDGVVVNRIFPTEDADEWRAGWVASQTEIPGRVSESFAGLPQWRSVYRTGEPVGVDALCELAREVYGEADPLEVVDGVGPFRITRDPAGAVVHTALPYVTRDEVGLAGHGDELVVSVASYRRLLTLPPGLSRHQITGARVVGGELRVRFKEGAS
ncbi:ArsA family ATPase [Nocardioides sp. B-3]|uniref:ArsA family ATPase n=1 Tax=Nocardioides sp. B-3 TaxID=2895565 RepID=UPI0021532E30|nr:ArsA-related P-loop ATPase [Nocardioides sp. B-3]